jgi:hypothetical protein
LYSLVFITFISTSVSFALLESYPVSPTEKLSFANKAVYFAEQLFVSSVFMIPTNHWLETGKKLKFINSWTDLQVRYTETQHGLTETRLVLVEVYRRFRGTHCLRHRPDAGGSKYL